MEQNTSVKFVVYGEKEGGDPIAVVDTIAEAKTELEGAKGSNAKIKIEKATVKNFGKDDEQTISSESVENWVREGTGAGDKVDNASPDDGGDSGDDNADDNEGGEGEGEQDGDGTEDGEEEAEKEMSFADYYENNGALMGYHYFLREGEEEQEEKEPVAEKKEKDTNPEPKEESVMGDGGKVDVEPKGIAYEEFIIECAKPEAKGIGSHDAKFTAEFLGDLKKHGVKDIKVNAEGKEIFFVTDDKTNYKELLKTINALDHEDCEEIKTDSFRMYWN